MDQASVSSSARPVSLSLSLSLSLSGVLLSHRFRQKLWAGASSPSQDSGLGRERRVQGRPSQPRADWLKSIISLIGGRLGTGDTPHHVIYQFCRDVTHGQGCSSRALPIIDPILQCEKNRERAVTNRSPTIMCLHARYSRGQMHVP